MEIFYILDASAFINGFELKEDNNLTVPEITYEIKDLKSKLTLDNSISEGKLIIKDADEKYNLEIEKTISKSGDNLRLSLPDKKLLALGLMIKSEGKNIKIISDDYSIQNVSKILDLNYDGIITEGIKIVYNWK
jgi:UPF0271 protein